MKADCFDWGTGEVTYWALDGIESSEPLEKQLDELKEDLAQVRFGARTVLDVGWYPEFRSNGEFVVLVVRDGAWDTPIFNEAATDIASLCAVVKRAVRAASDVDAV